MLPALIRDHVNSASPVPAAPKSIAHQLCLTIVWLTVALGSLVFIEPAPVDLLTVGLFVLLPLVGLFAYHERIAAPFAVMLAISALEFLAANFAFDPDVAIKHNAVSLYLFGAAFVFAGFIVRRPAAHTKLILNAYLVSAVLAAVLGIVGYLDLFDGAYETLTRYDRASGTFKDPNVFGPFLVPALLTALHMWLTQPLRRGIVPLILAAILSAGLLLSFSRGAWATAAIATGIYVYFYLLAAKRNTDRLKLAGLVIAASMTVTLVLAAALQSDAVSSLIEQRATLTQPYDEGPEGRFGGQEKAFDQILQNPFGRGGLQFAPYIHHEEPHNVYLTMFLSAGWTGGLLYIALCTSLLIAGFRHALKPTRTRGLFVIAYASLAATILLGFIIDSDHWRHFWLLTAIVIGLMAGDRRRLREGRIVADRRPALMQPLLIIGPSEREGRIVRALPPALTGNPLRRYGRQPALSSHRPPRLRHA